MKKFVFDKTKFYIHPQGNGPISSETVGVTKFRGLFLEWNRRYRPEKINREFLKTLI